MSLFTRPRPPVEVRETAAGLIPPRPSAPSSMALVNNDTAMRHSAVWACLRLRANLVSSFPVDAFRQTGVKGGIQAEVPIPPLLISPGGERWDLPDWMYATQLDLDRTGNTVGIISERNGYGLPARIDLQAISRVSITERPSGGLQYRIGGSLYDPRDVYHERQYVVAGLPVGLSPVAYAAWVIGQYVSSAQFAVDWYSSGGIPKAHLRNTELGKIDERDARIAKERFLAATEGRGLFVTGRDWEYKPIQAENVGSEWLDSQAATIHDVARFFDAPGDLIDAAVQGSSVTYANIVQRNLQFLVLSLQPTITRREKNLSKLVPAAVRIKLNTEALLRMDPQTRAAVMETKIRNRIMTVTEARALDNLPPLTPGQVEEFTTLFGSKVPPPVPDAAPTDSQPSGSPDA